MIGAGAGAIAGEAGDWKKWLASPAVETGEGAARRVSREGVAGITEKDSSGDGGLGAGVAGDAPRGGALVTTGRVATGRVWGEEDPADAGPVCESGSNDRADAN